MHDAIKFKFNISYPKDKFHTQYAELKDGRYAKTYMKNMTIETEFISMDEYASALMHMIIHNNSDNKT